MEHGQRGEVAGTVTRSLVGYLRRRQGEPGVRSLLEIAGECRPLTVLEDPASSSTLQATIDLFHAAELLTGDPAIARRVGEAQIDAHVHAGRRATGGLLASPGRVLRRYADLQQGWWPLVGLEVVELTRDGGSVTLTHAPGVAPSPHVCLHTQGVLAYSTVACGLPPATVAHPRCQARGASVCSFQLSWPSWQPIAGRLLRGAARRSVAAEVELLQGRIAELESTVAELVSTDDLDEALARIATRAGMAVRGQRFLLVVQLPEEGAPRVHSAGFAREDATITARELVAAAPDIVPRPDRVVAEVSSARRGYGWLVAYPEPGAAVEPGEHAQLEAYARLAAAALDAAAALADARRGDRAAQAILGLARELADEPDERKVTQRITEAVTAAIGCDRASLLLLDDDEQVLRTVAVHGFAERTADALAVEVSLDTAPALAMALTEPTARFYTAEDREPWVRQLTREAHAAALAVAPVLARDGLLGVLVASWSRPVPPAFDHEPVLRGLTGLADHAGVAIVGLRSAEDRERRHAIDPVTTLADLAAFHDRLTLHLGDRRRGSTLSAVCAIGLDGLPDVDDDLWGASANPALVEVAARIRRRLRETDAVARTASRELAVLLTDLKDRTDAEQVAVDLVAVLTGPIPTEGAAVEVAATVGITFAGPGTNAGELLRSARAALYEARADQVVYRVWQPPSNLPDV